ncbi:RidA family protein [Agromyces silvae]|uniref:RidA family protein n=1 Tax=Agromyces silvae TaxID=3388266 RepID=UPI00280B1DFF|nr:RidA family protein [Agromyces protaetiae]
MTRPFEPIEPDPANPPGIPISSAVRVGDLVYVSGQVSTEPGRGIVEDTFEGEFHRTIRNVEEILAAAGGTLDDVVRVNAYLRDEESRPLYNRLYAEAFTPPYPSRTTTGNHFSFIQIEIDCIAVIPRDRVAETAGD